VKIRCQETDSEDCNRLKSLMFAAMNYKMCRSAIVLQHPAEAGSNTSTVTLRVVGGDEKGNLKSETVKYGRKSQETRTEKDCAGKGQRHIQKTDPSSR
jgi:hypothetical protein